MDLVALTLESAKKVFEWPPVQDIQLMDAANVIGFNLKSFSPFMAVRSSDLVCLGGVRAGGRYHQRDVYKAVDPFLKSIEEGISFGGISAYDAEEFVACCKNAGRYECTIQGDFFKHHCYAHTFPPSVGQIQRMAADFCQRSQASHVLQWPQPVDVQVISGKPRKGNVTTLANEALWFGFLKYFADQIEAKNAPEISKCRNALRRVRVTFHAVDSADDAAKKKWSLEQQTQNIAGAQTLRGFKRILGYAEIRESLKAQMLPHNAEAISAWQHTANVQVSAKNLSNLLRVHDRMVAAGSPCLESIEQMDSRFGAEHFMSNTSVLAVLCEKTACPKNELLQNCLLCWVVQSVCYRALRENDGRHTHLPPNATRDIWLNVRLLKFVEYIYV
ncbi:Uncharacterized protein (Fragment) [Durusdinium trenchii]|uniref:Uncharacterized protein n=1 Tax=Durusdinium trenchii TaxID=1381693 RepID=A0ABP0K5I6_9DINO